MPEPNIEKFVEGQYSEIPGEKLTDDQRRRLEEATARMRIEQGEKFRGEKGGGKEKVIDINEVRKKEEEKLKEARDRIKKIAGGN
jgi:hypothetical protein